MRKDKGVEKMEEEKKKSFIAKHKMSIFVVVSAVVMLIGLSYAWLQLTLRGTKDLTLRAGNLSLVLDDSMEGGISMDSVVPVTDEEGKSQDGYTFTLLNNGSIASSYTIYLDDLALDEGQERMSDAFIKMSLTKEGEEEVLLLSQTVVDGKRVLDLGNIDAGSKYTYNLKMWIDENATNEVMGTVFKGQLRIEAMQDVKQSKNLAIQANDASVTYDTATDAQKKEMFAITHEAGRQQVGYSKDELTDYRYMGADPNNYVTFNDEVWRIIGIFTVEDENGKKERRMKLVRNESIGNYSWDNKGENGENDWSTSELQKVLNSGAYYNRTSGTCPSGQNGATTACDFTSNGLTDTAKSMIASAKWYLGGSNTYQIIADKFYQAERNANIYNQRENNWIGKVGMMYPSDYGYAAGKNSCFSTDLHSYNENCTAENWLFHSAIEWTITQTSSNLYDTFYVYSSGLLDNTPVRYSDPGTRPSVYLKSNVKVAMGDGSSANPYTLQIG